MLVLLLIFNSYFWRVLLFLFLFVLCFYTMIENEEKNLRRIYWSIRDQYWLKHTAIQIEHKLIISTPFLNLILLHLCCYCKFLFTTYYGLEPLFFFAYYFIFQSNQNKKNTNEHNQKNRYKLLYFIIISNKNTNDYLFISNNYKWHW